MQSADVRAAVRAGTWKSFQKCTSRILEPTTDTDVEEHSVWVVSSVLCTKQCTNNGTELPGYGTCDKELLFTREAE